jgi:hypothetical protein
VLKAGQHPDGFGFVSIKRLDSSAYREGSAPGLNLQVVVELYPLLRFLHLFASIVFVGGLFARQAVRALSPRAPDVGAIVMLGQAAGRIERLMVIPGNILAIVFGVALALYIRAPILGRAQGAERYWLLASVIILVLLFPLIPLVFLPRGRLFEAALHEAIAEGRVTPDLREHLADRTVRRAHLAEMIGVTLIVVLMVFKPF